MNSVLACQQGREAELIGTEVRYLFISLQNLLGQNQETFKLSFSKGCRFPAPTDSQELQGILSRIFWKIWMASMVFFSLLFFCAWDAVRCVWCSYMVGKSFFPENIMYSITYNTLKVPVLKHLRSFLNFRNLSDRDIYFPHFTNWKTRKQNKPYAITQLDQKDTLDFPIDLFFVFCYRWLKFIL